MVLTRSKSTVLGKRALQPEAQDTPNKTNSLMSTGSVQPTTTAEDDGGKKPKRTRTVEENVDPRANKENIPPDNTDPTIRTPTLRRTATETSIGSPRNVRSLPRRTALTSTVSTPTRSIPINKTASTSSLPTPPKALQPIHVRVRSALRPTCDSPTNTLSSRAEERAVLAKFLQSFLADDDQTALYVSGTPGTGKTALVHDVVRGLAGDDVQVVYMNCMALKDIGSMYARLLEELPQPTSKKGKKALKGKAAVEQLLESLDKRCILVLDELDHLTSSSDALSAIFSLACSSLCIIGIANTHTLTASLSTSEVQTLHFKSYAPTELVAIINTRLAALQADPTTADAVKRLLPAPALMLLSKKIASYTGDVRLLFEVLRGAIDRAVTTANSSVSEDPLNTPSPVVSPAHVLAALKASSSSSTTAQTAGASVMETKVQELGLKAQLVLLTILLAFKRVEANLSLSPSPSSSKPSPPSPTSSSLDTNVLHSYHTSTLNKAGETIRPASLSEFVDILGLLEGVGLVLLSSGGGTPSKRRKTFARTGSLSGGVMKRTQEVCIAEGIRVDEVLRGLGVAEDASCVPSAEVDIDVDVRKDEMRAVWRQEGARLAREVKVRDGAKGAPWNGDLEGAFEGARKAC